MVEIVPEGEWVTFQVTIYMYKLDGWITDELRGGNIHANKESVAICVSIWSNTVVTAFVGTFKARHPSVGPREGFPKRIAGTVDSSNSPVYLRSFMRSVGFSKQGPNETSVQSTTHSYGFSLSTFVR